MTRSILIVAGEQSGDNYGASLTLAYSERYGDGLFFGIGGPSMVKAGVDLIHPMEDLAVTGLIEVVSHLPRIRRIFEDVLAEAKTRRPDAAVLIDSPDFNLRLARRLRRFGIPVCYYISPTIWAWRRGRIHTLRKNVARMLYIFPFEGPLFEKYGIPAVFVGHPLIERVKARTGRAEFCQKHGLDPDRPLIAVLPGSRGSEIRHHASILMEALALIHKQFAAQFVVVKAEHLSPGILKEAFPGDIIPNVLIEEDSYDALAAADLALSSCGTANLEAALLETPVIAFYRLSPLTYRLGKPFVRINRYSIVNILAGKTVIPELIQDQFTPGNLAAETARILENAEVRDAMVEEFRLIRAELGESKASENAAAELHRLIQKIS
ncbi:MAG: lipid-A-disaccharide synthase [Acidobacteria bacterium]|nr:lipid-A-disaccharide synthase [Acidobacteriota bacterium]MBU4493801.1 lipid-A-disaccharide synthase [Acidobacteriota bacterium]MCG2816996.1 lipid-A-disaccharide synthase [Candidatus Aminicenantes bacterium]